MSDNQDTTGGSSFATHYFMPWLRQGLASQIPLTQDDGKGSPILAAGPLTAQLSLQVAVDPDTEVTPPAVTVNLYGPGNVTGFQPQAIIRTWPQPDVFDAEANHYPLIEFSDPDLPWRYTPAQANSDTERLRPWLCLIVLKDDEIKSMQPASPSHLLATVEPTSVTKVLADQSVENVLPDLTESWAWAHVQTLSQELPDKESVLATIQATPAAVISRILCTRQLTPRTSYTAFLVPTFRAGVDAGLGKPGPAPAANDQIAPAWKQSDTQAPILPVYYQWRFQTSELGDFKYFVNLLKPIVAPKEIGKRSLLVKQPGEDLPSASDSDKLDLEGVLLSPNATEGSWPDSNGRKFVTELTKLLNLSSDGIADPALVPPLYGRWHAEQETLNPGNPPLWFQELNSDPRLRVAAGLGTWVVQSQEKQLLLGAWRQFEQLDLAHYTARQSQRSREITQSAFARHVTNAPVESLFQLTSPLMGKLRSGQVTVKHLIRQSPIAPGTFEGQFRRILRPFGPIGRRQNRPSTLAQAPSLLGRMNAGKLSPANDPETPAGLATPANTLQTTLPWWATTGLRPYLQQLPLWLLILALILLILTALVFLLGAGVAFTSALAALTLVALFCAWQLYRKKAIVSTTFKIIDGTLQGQDLLSLPPRPQFVPQSYRDAVTKGAGFPAPSLRGGLGNDGPGAAAFRSAGALLLDRVQSPPRMIAPPVTLDFTDIQEKILQQIDPQTTFARRYTSCVTVAPELGGRKSFDPLAPPMPYPKFLEPMYKYLLDLGSEWIMPGLDGIPQNSVTLLTNNQKVIEAYLLGLNHEMGRKLMWNDYPTDERGDYFQHFWDVPGLKSSTPAQDSADKDILPLEDWDPQSHLGDHKPPSPLGQPEGDSLILLVRGELLHRYPNTLVYGTRALPDPDHPAQGTHVPSLDPRDEIYPTFWGAFGADLRIFGFPLLKSQAIGGSDAKDLGFFFVFQQIPTEPQFAYDVGNPHEYSEIYTLDQDPKKNADRNSAKLAVKSFRSLVRVAIHARRMLGES